MDVLGLRLLSSLPNPSTYLAVHGEHHHGLVLLAYFVACAGSYIPLTLSENITHEKRRNMRCLLMLTGALCLAGGIWSMHFISMLALNLPISVHYELNTTVLSLALALAAAMLAMYSLVQKKTSWQHQFSSAFIIGSGITAMHYCGMASVISSAQMYYHGGLLLLSWAIAISASFAALLLVRVFSQPDRRPRHWVKVASALIMGLAITSMHFTGMAALHMIVPTHTSLDPNLQTNALQLSLLVATLTLLIICFGQSVAWFNHRLGDKERDLNRVHHLLNKLDMAHASLEAVAHIDDLTQLLNRRGFSRDFAEKLAQHRQQNSSLAVMFLDIDHFKRINDSLGHAIGDQLLCQVADRLRKSVRAPDLIARFGGDEFCIVISLENRGIETARWLSKRLLDSMKKPFILAGHQLVVTLSIGISLFDKDGDCADELLKCADMALYQSKGAGRNTATFFDACLTRRVSEELRLEQDLRRALSTNQGLELYYQPIIDRLNGNIYKLEVLVRWHHLEYGFLSPDRFIAIAENNGFIHLLDGWVLRQACLDLKVLQEHGYSGVRLAINCSPLNFGNQQLIQGIAEVLEETRTDATLLELEITESALLNNLERATETFNGIRQLGLSLSLDDFGTGYSSLAYLRRLPLDTLKIDRSFVQGMEHSSQAQDIVKAIISMAHSLRLKVVAEGVETSEQYALLNTLDCDYLQGYLFSKPLSLQRLLEHFPHHEQVCPLPLTHSRAALH